jgi:hypothetical protein
VRTFVDAERDEHVDETLDLLEVQGCPSRGSHAYSASGMQ